LVHVSQLAHKFVTDAREVVKTGDIVKVQVVEVDVARKRIALTMKLGGAPSRRDAAQRQEGNNRFEAVSRQQRSGVQLAHAPQSTAMTSAFSKLKGLGRPLP
jgi:uncharacterized protein